MCGCETLRDVVTAQGERYHWERTPAPDDSAKMVSGADPDGATAATESAAGRARAPGAAETPRAARRAATASRAAANARGGQEALGSAPVRLGAGSPGSKAEAPAAFCSRRPGETRVATRKPLTSKNSRDAAITKICREVRIAAQALRATPVVEPRAPNYS